MRPADPVADDAPATRPIPFCGFVPKPRPTPTEAAWPRVPGYELLSVIGSGGMGIVYKARHRTLQRTVALKTLQGAILADPEFRQRFYAEAEAVARLQHPNIIQVFEVGTVEPQLGEPFACPFIALEFVDGGSLADRANAPQSPRYAAEMVTKLARAVHAAHGLGVIHRDLKPANVLLTRDGEPKVADFGVAKQLDNGRDDGNRFLTRAGTALGTPEYMAPEQVAGDEPRPTLDIYALGVILYELLTARVPFQAATPEETMYLVRYQEAVSPRRLQPGLPRDLETICLKCLQKTPGMRYESAAAVADDLERWRNGQTIRARPVGAPERVVRLARRNPVVAALSIAVVLVALAGLSGVVWKWQEAQAHADAAELSATVERATARAERWERYRANLVAASSALQLNNVGAARRSLDGAPEEYRNWEWRHFRHQVDTAHDVLRWPGAVVGRANVTPDGAFVMAFGDDRTIRIWDVAGRKEVCTITDATKLTRVVLSGDARTLAGIAPDNTCVVRDVPTGRVRVLSSPGKHFVGASINRDGTRLATLADDGTFRVYDTGTGAALLTEDRPTPDVKGLDLSADGRRAALVVDREVHLWDVTAGRETTVLRGHQQGIQWSGFDPEGDRAFTVEHYPSNTIRLWDVATGSCLAELRGHTNAIQSPTFSPDHQRIATGGLDKTARLWDANGALVAVLKGHTGWVQGITFSPDGKRVVTASQDHTLRLWDAANGASLAVLRGHTEEVHAVGYTADGSQIVSAARDGTVRVWDAAMVERNGILRDHTSFVYGVAFHPDGRRVASAGWDGTVRLWDATTGQQTRVLDCGPKTIVSAVAFHPAGHLLASIGRDDKLRLWDVDTGEQVQQWPVPTGGWRDTRLAFNRQGGLLATGGVDGTVRLWDVNRRTEVAVLRGHKDAVRDVAFSPDGRWLASAGDTSEHVIRIWDVAGQKEIQLLEGHTFGVYALAFNGDGKLLASGSLDGTVRLWDTTTWREIAVLKHGTNVYGVAFTPDGTRLASACADNTIRLWDVDTHQEVVELRGHEDYVHALAFSPDGTRLVSASGDRTVRVWDTFQPQERAATGR